MDVATLDELRIVLDPAGQFGIAIALLLIMFGIALGLRVKDFTFLLRHKLQFFGGVLAQILGLPLITLALVALLEPAPSIALGMFVVACCPGGSSSNLLTYLARGNVAYSVSLTATSSALAAFLTPASILFWSNTYEPTSSLLRSIDFNAAAFLTQTSLLLAVPLVAGMLLAARAPDIAARLRRVTVNTGALLLAGVIAYGIVYFYALLWPALPILGLITVTHNLAAFALGALAATALQTDRPTGRALTFEVGIQNSGLAIVILIAQFNGLGAAAAIAAVWGVWHLIAGGIMVVVFRFSDRMGSGT